MWMIRVLAGRTQYGDGPPDGGEGQGRSERKAGGTGDRQRAVQGMAWPGGLGLRRGVSRSLSSRCRRDRHQTHSPWGRGG